MLHNFHVDDLSKSLKTIDDTIKAYEKQNEFFLLGGFHLTKWINDKIEILNVIPKSDTTKELKHVDLEIDRLPVERGQGIQ